MPLTDLQRRVRAFLRATKKGQVFSYAEVAALAGAPGSPRAVVRALHALDDVPWWRVVKADRTLAPPVAKEQARRLGAEGVAVVAPGRRGGRVKVALVPPRNRRTR